MDRNFILALGLSFLIYTVWSVQFAPKPPLPGSEEIASETADRAARDDFAQQPPTDSQPESRPGSELESVTGLPALQSPRTAAPMMVSDSNLSAAFTAADQSEKISFETLNFRAELTTRGAGITLWELKHFDSGPNAGHEPIVLTTGSGNLGTTLLTPFRELGLGDLSLENFELVRAEGLEFDFRYTRNGVTVRKEYRFREDSYAFELHVGVENQSPTTIVPLFAVTLPAAVVEGQDFKEQGFVLMADGSREVELLSGLGTGSWWGGEAKREIRYPSPIDWIGVGLTYFVSAVVPEDPTQAHARVGASQPGKSGVVQVYFNGTELPPGQSASRVFQVYMGPKEPERLQAVDATLLETIDLGWSWVRPLTRAFNWLLKALHSFVPNYGLAIIILTIMVRLATAPLTNKQMRSMERMRALSPKLKELKEKYGDDRQKQSEEMMKLYRQEGVNPLGGCLPMVLQLPVFIGLFYALRSSIQLRQAPFFGWINDLSAPDALFIVPGLDLPFRVLPLIMGATMFLQQKITPMQQMDPAQQKMMVTMMPIMMTFVFYQFPSGLVLYWMVSNVLAVSHQLWIGKGLRK